MSQPMDLLISEYLDGSIEPSQLKELEAWINESPENADRFANAIFFDERLRAEFAVRACESGFPVEIAKTRQLAEPIEASSPWALRLAIAASLALAIGMTYWFVTSVTNETPSVARQDQTQAGEGQDTSSLSDGDRVTFATVTHLDQAQWPGEVSYSIGDRLTSQVIAIESGFLKLYFDDGVEVTLEGPAEYQLVSTGRTRLVSGLLTASVPPGAEGFRVDTPSAEVVDLGTEFGVEVGKDGVSEVSVFDGKVEVVSKPVDDPQAKDERKLLVEGESARLEIDGTIKPVKYNVARYENMGRFSHGIARSTGSFRFAPPWRRLSQLRDNSKIFVMPEGFATELEKACEIDISKPGRYRNLSDLTDDFIPVASRVKSYLFLFQPTENEKRPASRITGSITFAKPILGLIVSRDKLRESDGQFSPQVRYKPQFIRALELNGRGGDIVTLSEDRRTVTLDLIATEMGSDHLRVIVDAALPRSAWRRREMRVRNSLRDEINKSDNEKGDQDE